MGSTLLAGSGLFHSWMLCLPMLVIVQSSSYNFIRLLLSTMFILYFTKWSPYYKIYQTIHCLVSLLRYRRVEKYCDKCERHLSLQLNNSEESIPDTPEEGVQNSVLAKDQPENQEEANLSPKSQQNVGDAKHRENIKPTTKKVSEKTNLIKTPQQIGWRLRGWRRFPWRVFSRNWGRITNTHFYPQWVNTFLIWIWAKGFGCNLDDAELNWTEYKTLGHFFTRKLKPGVRPISSKGQLVSPADGKVTYFGQFKGGFLEQVKGSHYSLNYFLGLQKENKCIVNGVETVEILTAPMHASVSEKNVTSTLLHRKDGSTVLMQMIIYLSPGDYHRFHSPADWSVTYRR